MPQRTLLPSSPDRNELARQELQTANIPSLELHAAMWRALVFAVTAYLQLMISEQVYFSAVKNGYHPYKTKMLYIRVYATKNIDKTVEFREICAESMKLSAAVLICRRTYQNSTITKDDVQIGASFLTRRRRGVMYRVHNIRCPENETKLSGCKLTPGLPENCESENTLAIDCAVKSSPALKVTTTIFSYINGVAKFDSDAGVVNVSPIPGFSGLICTSTYGDDAVGDNEAKVACRSAGQPVNGARVISPDTVLHRARPRYGNKYILRDLVCHGTESNFLECQHQLTGWKIRDRRFPHVFYNYMSSCNGSMLAVACSP